MYFTLTKICYICQKYVHMYRLLYTSFSTLKLLVNCENHHGTNVSGAMFFQGIDFSFIMNFYCLVEFAARRAAEQMKTREDGARRDEKKKTASPSTEGSRACVRRWSSFQVPETKMCSRWLAKNSRNLCQLKRFSLFVHYFCIECFLPQDLSG